MNKKVLFSALLFLFLLPLVAQEKTLSLEDVVLRQFAQFYPESIAGLQWVAGTDGYSWLSDDYQSVLHRQVGRAKTDTLVTVKEINQALDLGLKTNPNPNWLDSERFYFSHNKAYYIFDIKKKTGEKWLDIPQGENLSFNIKAESFALTRDNNLLLHTWKGDTIAITNFDDPNRVAGQAIARHEFGISDGIFWSPDGSAIAFYQKDESRVTNYPLLDINSTPGSLVEIKYPMAGQGSEKASVGVYDLDSGKTLYLNVGGPDDQYLTNLGWGPDSRYIYLAVLNRGQNHMKLQQFDALNGQFVKTIFEEKHDKYVEPEQPVRFIPGSNQEFLWFSERDGFNHLYRYNLKGEILNQVTFGKWEAQQIVGFDKNADFVFVSGTDESGLNQYLYKASLNTKKLKRLTQEPGIHRYDMSGSGRYFIDNYSHVKTPRRIDVIDDEGKIVRTLLEASDPLEGYPMGECSLVELKAENGMPLHGRLIKPYDFDPAKKYPVLVYVYGGPHLQLVNNSWMQGAPLWMHYFANRGYLVFTLDNRGSANRGLDFENIIHRRVGEMEIRDQLVGVDYLKSLDFVDGNRLAVHGWSFGGYMTASLMLKTPGIFKVGVGGGPVTDWKYYEVMYGERYMDTPQENPEGYELTSLLNKAGNLQGKLLLIHGTSDDVVVMQHNLSLIKAFVDEGKQVDFFPYPGHAHNVRGKDRLHLMEKVLGYIEEKL